MSSTILFATQSYQYLAEELVAESNSQLAKGKLLVKEFPDGEHYHRIETDVRGQHVWLLGGTTNDTSTMELFDLAQGCVQYGAFSLTIIIPYFGYSTMERSVLPGEIVKAKNRAVLFSAIPETPLGNKIVLIDLHAEGIPFYFEAGVKPYHIHSTELIAQTINEIDADKANVVLASTDAGRAKLVEYLANYIGVGAAFIYKRRLSGSDTQVTAVNASVLGRHVVIYDDMIRTGGSVMSAAQAYLNEGASKVSAVTTHGLFTANAVEKIAASGIIDRIISFNTHPNAVAIKHDLLQVKSIAPLMINKLLDEGSNN